MAQALQVRLLSQTLMSSFSTHLPVLDSFLTKYNGRVLELGIGPSSTSLIIEKSLSSISLEDNITWFEQLHGLSKPNHEVRLVSNWKNAIEQCGGPFDLVFVDSGNWQDRCDAIYNLRDRASVVLLHDSFIFHMKRCECQEIPDYRALYKYRKNFYPVWPPVDSHPPTMAMSNTIDIATWQVEGFTEEFH